MKTVKQGECCGNDAKRSDRIGSRVQQLPARSARLVLVLVLVMAIDSASDGDSACDGALKLPPPA